MKTAADLLDFTNNISSSENQKTIKKLSELTEAAASKGSTQVHVYTFINKPVKDYLISLGYKVSYNSDRNEPVFTISW